MTQKIYQVDAFTNHLFGGNPSAVCPLNDWLNDILLQKIALENNLSETAFYIKRQGQYHIRWFTPEVEVDLCGHATLAAAHVVFNHENHEGDTIHFYSERSGELSVSKTGSWLTLNFPTDTLEEVKLTDKLTAGFNIKPVAGYKGKTDYMFQFETEDQVRRLHPNFNQLKQLDCRGIIATSKGNAVDFVSRFFTPQCGINEDPVTGSAHTTLIPFWSQHLGKTELSAQQVSQRGGELKCVYRKERVEISGQARLYMTGIIHTA
jgi:PhzF family phenazine biosynthesis protein